MVPVYYITYFDTFFKVKISYIVATSYKVYTVQVLQVIVDIILTLQKMLQKLMFSGTLAKNPKGLGFASGKILTIPSLHLTSTLFSHKSFFFCLFSLGTGTPLIKIHECMSKISSFAIPKPKTWFSNGKAAKKI